MIKAAVLAALEGLINRLLRLDERAQSALAAYHGKILCIHLSGPEINLYLIPDEQGGLQLYDRIEALPDATISATPLDLISALNTEQADQVFSGQVHISGDHRFAQSIARILADLDIDWEEQLSRIIGDPLAHQIGLWGQDIKYYLQRMQQHWAENISDYLVHEQRLLPHRLEMEDFLSAVDQLRDDVDRLEARIKRLES